MNLMTDAAARALDPTADMTTSAADILLYATGNCAFGKVLIARSIKGVCAILLGDDANALEADLARRYPQSTLVQNAAIVCDDLAKVARYANNSSEGSISRSISAARRFNSAYGMRFVRSPLVKPKATCRWPG